MRRGDSSMPSVVISSRRVLLDKGESVSGESPLHVLSMESK